MSRYSDLNYKVYIHRNQQNGKVYVGCTKKPLSVRFDNGNGYRKCTRFWADIERFGWNGFDHILVADGLTRVAALLMEDELVCKLNSMNPEHGYNMRRGGVHNVPCPEVGRAISAAKMGHQVTEETRAKLSQYARKPVVQMDLDGATIAIFPSLTAAALACGAYKSNIWAVCAGRKSTCCGFRWAYADKE